MDQVVKSPDDAPGNEASDELLSTGEIAGYDDDEPIPLSVLDAINPSEPVRQRGRPKGVKDTKKRTRRTQAQIDADQAAKEQAAAEKAAAEAPAPVGAPLPLIDEAQAPQPRLVGEGMPDLGNKAVWPNQWENVKEVDNLYDLKFKPIYYPRDGLIPLYLKWAGLATDISPAAHWAGITAAIAAQLGRGQRVAQGDDGVVPSFFVLVLAESGGRKSYSLKLLRSCLPDDSFDSTLPRSDTSLLKILVNRPWRFWCLDEATSLFKLFGSEWSSSLAEFLCRIYDGDEVRTTTITRGELATPPMHLSLVALTTFANLLRGGIKSNAVEELIGGGLFGRFFVVPLAKPEKPRPEANKPDPNTRAYIKGYLTNLRQACPWNGHGEGNYNTYDLTPEARLELLRWQSVTGAGGMKPPPYEGIASMWTRLHVQVKRLALIYHLSRGKAKPSDPIGVESLLPALFMVHEYLLPSMLWFARKARYGSLMIKIDRVRDELQAATYGLRFSELCKLCGLSTRERIEALAILADEVVYEWWMPNAGRGEHVGRPHTVIVPKEKVQETLVDGKVLRAGERRTRKYAPPPPTVKNAIREMTDGEAAMPHVVETVTADSAEIDAREGR
jgi:hypothetical protein